MLDSRKMNVEMAKVALIDDVSLYGMSVLAMLLNAINVLVRRGQ